MTDNEIANESEQDLKFLEEIAALPEGEGVLKCLQCGTCSATCPVSDAMDVTPRKLFAMIRAGQKDKVLSSMALWLCASCYQCTMKCPAGVRITDILYALKRRSIKDGRAARGAQARRFNALFTDLVGRYGRSHEVELMARLMLPRNPMKLMLQSPLGMQMIMRGRLPLLPHQLEDREGFRRMVSKAYELEGGRSK